MAHLGCFAGGSFHWNVLPDGKNHTGIQHDGRIGSDKNVFGDPCPGESFNPRDSIKRLYLLQLSRDTDGISGDFSEFC